MLPVTVPTAARTTSESPLPWVKDKLPPIVIANEKEKLEKLPKSNVRFSASPLPSPWVTVRPPPIVVGATKKERWKKLPSIRPKFALIFTWSWAPSPWVTLTLPSIVVDPEKKEAKI